jgi:hypothetical protein
MRDLTGDLLDDETGDIAVRPDRTERVRSRPRRRLLAAMAVGVAVLVVVGFGLAVIGARTLSVRAQQDDRDAHHRLLIGASVHGLVAELTRQAALTPTRRDLTALAGSARLGLAGSRDTTPVVATTVAVSAPDVLATVTVVTSDGHSTTLVHEARRQGSSIAITGCTAMTDLDAEHCDARLRGYLTQHAS